MMEPIEPRKRFEIVRFIIMSGWVVTILVSGLVIFTAVYLSIFNLSEPPEFIKSMANTAFGFLVGSFVALVKDFISEKSE